MSGFSNLKLRTKLLGSFMIIAFLMALVGGIGMIKMKAVEEGGNNIYVRSAVPIGELMDVATAFQRIRVNLRDMILDSDQAKKQQYAAKIGDLQKTMNTEADKFEKSIKAEEV
jgi:methyl-accepting chemotaxis protein